MWTLERKGAFSREALFGGNGKISLSVSQLLQEYHGLFMFLCEVWLEGLPNTCVGTVLLGDRVRAGLGGGCPDCRAPTPSSGRGFP